MIFPYIGGEEVNNSPTHAHHRYVINFGEMTRGGGRERWPELMAIVEEKVKPERMTEQSRRRIGAYWWQFGETAPSAVRRHRAAWSACSCIAGVSQHLAFAFLPTGMVFAAHARRLRRSTTYAAFCVLQSRPHEIWARFFGSSMKDDLRYTPSDCFETFPFPEDWETHPTLEAAGKAYYELPRRSSWSTTTRG